MIDALISGKLIRDTETKISSKGNAYCNFLLSVSIGEELPVIVSGIAFSESAERISRLKKGDALTVTGALKPSTWNDKSTGEEKHGLSVTVSSCLSTYDVAKRHPAK
ncbi:MAG: single-stranded DNA-binding protein [Methylococcales bacterium]|nr:single-stranded DNA-binding protein [Methylococcales bacterium]